MAFGRNEEKNDLGILTFSIFLLLITKMPLIHLTHEYNQLGIKLEIFIKIKEKKNMFRDFEFFLIKNYENALNSLNHRS